MPTRTKPLKPLKPGMGIYQVLHWPKEAAKAGYPGKPWAVVNLQTGGAENRFHATKEEALAQARALYAKLGDKAKVHSEEVHNAFFCFADSATLIADGNDTVRWVEAIAPKTYVTPAYGDVVISPDKIDNFIHNFSAGVRGQDVAINYEHGVDPAKGNKAAGWIRGARKNDKGNLELGVEFTEPAKEEVINKEWKYFSLEWDDEWLHPDGQIFKDVIIGGALTNRPVAKGLMPINFSEVFTEVLDESKELEHSDPGTGNPPMPRTDGDGADEPDRGGGWRRNPPPIVDEPQDKVVPKGGKKLSEFALSEKNGHELLRILELPVDANDDKVIEAIKFKFGELDALREAVSAEDQQKMFAEKYPEYWREHNELMKRDRANTAKQFSESVSKIRKTEGYGLKETKQGLSVQALEKVQEVHRKFGERTVTVEDFESCIKAIVHGGIVQFGEIGNNNEDELPDLDTNTAGGIAGARRMFAEVVSKIMAENPELDIMAASELAAKKHPDLAEAYRVTLPA